MRKLVTIICPVFNEEDNIDLFYQRACSVLTPLESKYDFEILFTNNCSQDGTLPRITKLQAQDQRIKVLSFSRNFGYQASLTAGLTHAHGEAIVNIDVDCEDPPEMIALFIKKWEEGYDIVYGIRAEREEAFLMRSLRKLFYRINKLIADSDVILDMAEFFLITSEVRDSILKSKTTFPFIRTEVAYVGFSRIGICYRRAKRQRGETHYNFFRNLEFAVAGLLSSSTFPLRFIVYSACVIVPVNLLVLFFWFLYRPELQTVAMVLFVNVTFLICYAAILALYIARIYKNGLERPLYVVDKKNSYL